MHKIYHIVYRLSSNSYYKVFGVNVLATSFGEAEFIFKLQIRDTRIISITKLDINPLEYNGTLLKHPQKYSKHN